MDRPEWQGQWEPLRGLQREVGRIFEAFEPLQGLRIGRPFPAINLYDAGDRFVLTAELPGMSPEQFDLSVTGETLILKGERTRPEGIAEESYRRQERPFGRWTRTVTLPERIESAQVAAEFADGVLAVTLPKAEGAKPRHIRVMSPAP